MHYPTVPGFRAAALALASLVLLTPALASTLFERGIEAFRAERYYEARQLLEQAGKAAPEDPLTSLWFGVALKTTGGDSESAGAWRLTHDHPRLAPVVRLLRGLEAWYGGHTVVAKDYFSEAAGYQVAGQPYGPARALLERLSTGGLPPVARWAEAIGLPLSQAELNAPPPDVAPTAPAAPAAPAVAPAPPPATPAPVAPAPAATPRRQPARPVGYTPWEAYPAHRLGDRVQYRPANTLWKTGTVREIGTQGAFANKYLVVDDQTRGTDYTYYGDVAGFIRQDFWTGFFVGTWALGSGMSVNTRVEGSRAIDEYLYVGATEKLEVKADGTYVWEVSARQRLAGRWEALPAQPGIVLLKGPQDRDYTFFNCTDPATVDVMKEHHARLASPGVMSTLARRKIP